MEGGFCELRFQGVLGSSGVRSGPLFAALQLEAPYEVLDGVPVPLMARCRGNRHRCFANKASIGCGGSDREWYYGLQLLLTVTPCGLSPASCWDRAAPKNAG